MPSDIAAESSGLKGSMAIELTPAET